MHNEYGCLPSQLHAFFGPCAHLESYAASPELIELLQNNPLREKVLTEYDGKLHFNLPHMNLLQLEACGVHECNCYMDLSKDTIITDRFWSYRRDGEKAGRQLTVAVLT